MKRKITALCFLCFLFAGAAHGGTQAEEVLSGSVRGVLHRAISDQVVSKSALASSQEEEAWLLAMSRRLEKRMPDADARSDFLRTVHYEAKRAGLDPQLVLGLIEVESGFRKYAVSEVGAKGYMQVMPHWVKEIGTDGQDLFHLRTNLRFGCTILRYYVDIEKGDLYRALGRYNEGQGSPEFPNMVRTAWLKYGNNPNLAELPTPESNDFVMANPPFNADRNYQATPVDESSNMDTPFTITIICVVGLLLMAAVIHIELLSNLWGGNLGLATTYWGFGVLGGFVWAGGIFVLGDIVRGGGVFAKLIVFMMLGYYFVTYVGTWRASNKYVGSKVWAILAKFTIVVVVLPVAIHFLKWLAAD